MIKCVHVTKNQSLLTMLQAPNPNMWYAPVEEYNNKPYPQPKWVDHCQHVTWTNILMRVAEIKNKIIEIKHKVQSIHQKIIEWHTDDAKTPATPNLGTTPKTTRATTTTTPGQPWLARFTPERSLGISSVAMYEVLMQQLPCKCFC